MKTARKWFSLHAVSALVAVVFACAATQVVAADKAADPAATATALLDSLDAGDFDAASVDFNAEMKSALGADKLQAVQQQIESAGAVKSRDEATQSSRDGFTVVVVRIHRELASIDATVSIDAAGKVAGLHFAPASATPAPAAPAGNAQ